MIKIKKKWGLKEEDFLKRSRVGHSRTGERWLALYWLIQGVSQMEVASRLNRTRDSIREWQQSFEQKGPEGLEYKKAGGRERTLTEEEEKQLVQVVIEKHPKEVGFNEVRWTMDLASLYCKNTFQKELTNEGCRHLLRRRGVVLRRTKKSLKERINRNKSIF